MSLIAAIFDSRYVRRGGVRSTRKEKSYFGLAVTLGVGLLVGMGLLGASADSLGQQIALLFPTLFGLWELRRFLTRESHPLATAAPIAEAGSSSLTRQPTRGWRLVLGALLFLSIAATSANPKPSAAGDSASALAALFALFVIVGVAVRLIASGLPKWIGSKEFTRARRRLWFKLAGLGLVAMIVVALALAALSQFVASTLVMWAYWFGWTWISWRIADERTKLRFSQPVLAANEPGM